MSLPLWSVKGLKVGVDEDSLLDAPQSQVLLLLYYFHSIPIYHIVRGGCIFSESRLVVRVCQFLSLIPCVGLPQTEVGCLNYDL